MADYEEYRFPDDEVEIEIIDDVPEEDRINAQPLPKDIVDEIDNDDLESYSKEAKQRLLQMKKLINDERRAKDAAIREQTEATRIAQIIVEENKQLKGRLSTGVKEKTAQDLGVAKQEYKDAYDSGDADRLVEAQEKLTDIKIKLKEFDIYDTQYQNNDIQFDSNAVDVSQPTQRLEAKTQAWLDKNKWYGVDEDMSFLALGIHKRLEKEGVATGSEHYWDVIDTEMRRRFPDKFGENAGTKNSATTKKSSVVAPASRSTQSKRIRLTPTQLALAKKFKLTPEQYHNEITKLESQND
jgi:hypothetical protein